MSFLRTRSASNAPVITPQYTGLQIQTSSAALPLAIVYGINKIAPNIVWAGDFQVIPQYTYTQSSGGKGGGGGSSATLNGYDYETAFIMGLCEGPIDTVGTVWNGSTLTSLGGLGFSLFTGTTPQAPWSFVASTESSESLGYNGLAYVASPDYDMGSSASLDSLSFEVYGVLYSSAVVNSYDADPALVIQDFLTNAQYGVGFPAASIDATTLLGSSGGASYQIYCQACGLAISPALTDQEAASSILARWLQLTNTAVVWSGGKLKFIPYGDVSVTGSLYAGGTVTFNPYVTPIYDLDDDDYVYDDGNDPVNVQRTDPYAAYNYQPIEIYQRSNYYDATPIVAFDQNAIELYGLRVASTVTAHEICDPNVAQTSAQLILQRGLYIRNHYTFKLSWEYCLLEPMDLVTLTDAGLGLSNTAVRIVSIEEDDDGILSFTCEEFPGGVATSSAYPVQTNANVPVNRGVAADPVNTPIIFEPPAALTGGIEQIWCAVSGGASGVADPNWGGANVWASTDGTTYGQVGAIIGAARQGVTTATLGAPSGGNPDTTHTLSVSLVESAGTLTTASETAAQNATTLCIVGTELLAYANAALTGTNAYALTYLERGLDGSTVQAHASGTPFARLDGAIFKYTVPEQYIGQTLHLKFQSFNIFGQGVQDISTCTAYTITPIGSGILGPVTAALQIGINLDYSLASLAINESDDWGLASDPYVTIVDMGLASA